MPTRRWPLTAWSPRRRRVRRVHGRLREVRGEEIIAKRAGWRATGARQSASACRSLFARGAFETRRRLTAGCGAWPGDVVRLEAPVVPHMGWNNRRGPGWESLFRRIDPGERFTSWHSYAPSTRCDGTMVTWATHGQRCVAAVETGRCWAAQFHPEKSGDAGGRAAVRTGWRPCVEPHLTFAARGGT